MHVRRVVARSLDVADASWRRAVVLVDDQRVDRLQSTLVIRPDWRADHTERVLGRGPEPDCSPVAEEEWAEVHRTTVPMRRHEVEVVLEHAVDRFVEHLRRHDRHVQSLAPALEARGVRR